VDKKGAMMETVVKAIPVILIGAILLGVVLVGVFYFTKSSVDREACRDSVLLKARSKVLGETLFDQIQCEIDNVEVKATGEDEIYGEIAGEMYDCWYQFGEGKVDFLDNYDAWQGDNWCFVCSKISFDEEVQEEHDELDGLYDFLSTKTIPLKEEQTFFQYMYGEVEDVEGDTSTKTPVDVDEEFYVSFFADKRQGVSDLWAGGGQILAGTALCGVGILLAVKTALIGTPAAIKMCMGGITLIGTGTTTLIAHKSEYIVGLYAGDADSMMSACKQ